MDTSEDKSQPVSDVPPVTIHLPETAMLDELAQALDEQKAMMPALEKKMEEAKVEGEQPQKGKKHPRFGKNPDGTPAKKADKKEVERKSPWGRYLHQYKLDHPELHSLEATIEARKLYTPVSGKQKSFEKIFTEVWKTKNPRWQTFTKEQRIAAIRADFIKCI
jgi:hypothetical protein